ncbi:MAG TPA: MXAN_5808 family serine peptidase [Polyangiaceae bacterium]
MRILERFGRGATLLGLFALASYFALQFGSGGLWRGLEAAHAGVSPGEARAPYDLTQLVAVNETLKTIRDKYVDPNRVKPRQMFLSALNQIQKEVAQVIISHDEKSPTVRVKVETAEADFRVDNVQGPWDVAARLREVFAFLQSNLKDTEVDLRDVEYAACNGMLRTLDPHSVFLSPEAYREMNLSTSGHFGGLGIVISIRDQMLTIMRPMPGTPAGRSGLKRLDRITKINNESTLNMPLDDAVKRLRGRPSTKVTIWVHRDGKDGWTGSRPFELVREEIRIESVSARPLTGGVGYVRLNQFQASTSDELEKALDQLRKADSLQALVLDLRGNPGGLLDQAAKVADTFLEDGVIVSTQGISEGREEKRATRRGTEPSYPVVVLVSSSSASASEIVAGALKGHERAIVVGQATFGKGTVQLVFPRITPDGAALKLTIAQYMTPGDVSIQGTGVAPDVELDPMTADPLEMDLFIAEHSLRERDLSKSLVGDGRRPSEPPFFRLRYNLPESERAKLREIGADLDDEFQLDFAVRFARDLADKLKPGKRSQQLRAVKGLIEQVEKREIASISKDLAALGIDWQAAPAAVAGPGPSDFKVSVSTDQANHAVQAGKPMDLKVSVTNNGDKPIYQLRAQTESDAGYYDEKELVFGRVEPGQTKSAQAPLGFCSVEGRKPGSTQPVPLDAKRVCKVPMDAVTRQDVVKVRFFAEGGQAPPDAELRPTVTSLPRPIFAYSYQIMDNRPGNGDGQLSRGEGATVLLTVKNVGKGRSYETQANLRNLTGDGLLLHAGRFDVSNMNPGEVREVAFTFDVLDGLAESELTVELSVTDRDLRVGSNEKLTVPVTKGGLFINPAKGALRIGTKAEVRSQPLAAAPTVGTLEAGSVVEQDGRFGDFARVELRGGRWGFVEVSKTAAAPGKRAQPRFTPELSHSPPLLEVELAALATRDGTVRIQGKASDPDRVLDTFIFVGTRKIFYQSNRGVANDNELSFDLSTNLLPGINVVTVVAREDEHIATRRTMVVRRDGPNGEALPTPKSELFGEDWEFVSGEGN